MSPPLIIFRHGQTEWNREGVFQGRSDSPLTEMGRQQANGLSALIAPLLGAEDWAAYTSPQGRSKLTASLALGPLGIEATLDDRLVEIDVGDWCGLSHADVADQAPPAVAHDAFAQDKRRRRV